MKKMLVFFMVLLIGCSVVFAAAQAETASSPKAIKLQKGDKIGVAFTSRAFQRWAMDGDNISKALKESG